MCPAGLKWVFPADLRWVCPAGLRWVCPAGLRWVFPAGLRWVFPAGLRWVCPAGLRWKLSLSLFDHPQSKCSSQGVGIAQLTSPRSSCTHRFYSTHSPLNHTVCGCIAHSTGKTTIWTFICLQKTAGLTGVCL